LFLAYADYLYATSEIDSVGRTQISNSANAVQTAVNAGRWKDATTLWGTNQFVIEENSANVDFYNILNRSGTGPSPKTTSTESTSKTASIGSTLKTSSMEPVDRAVARMNAVYKADPLTDLMNGPIRQKLGIIPSNVTWGGQSDNVFSYLSTAFMQPYIAQVDFLLAQGVNVNIYSGNLDLICCTTGTINWMNKLTWPDYKNFVSATRKSFGNMQDLDLIVGFNKKYKNLALWNILQAGHMVPSDQPQTGRTMLEMIITS